MVLKCYQKAQQVRRLGRLLKIDCWAHLWSCWVSRSGIYISNKFPGDSNGAGPRNQLRTTVHSLCPPTLYCYRKHQRQELRPLRVLVQSHLRYFFTLVGSDVQVEQHHVTSWD